MSEHDEDAAFTIGTGCFAVVVLTPLIVLFRGFVLMKLWGWFLVPLGLPSVGMVHALGIAVVISMFVPTDSNKQNDEESGMARLGRIIGVAAIAPALALLFGWILTFFMN